LSYRDGRWLVSVMISLPRAIIAPLRRRRNMDGIARPMRLVWRS
jgi:hypothetical protein